MTKLKLTPKVAKQHINSATDVRGLKTALCQIVDAMENPLPLMKMYGAVPESSEEENSDDEKASEDSEADPDNSERNDTTTRRTSRKR